MPRVTVLMPLFNGVSFIKESLHSIQAQTYQDWEFIIVNDFGSNDGCADIVREYAEKDSRIKLVQTEKRLGLAASLNLGLDMAQGEYVARVDVDDPSDPSRLEKQVAFMDAHPELSLCSCWQISKTPDSSKVQKFACEPEELKAAMFFGNEISHCGVMLRLADFNSHRWRYDPGAIATDYELWTRILSKGAAMANIPEALVTHRSGYEKAGFDDTGLDNSELIKEEVRKLSRRSLKRICIDTGKYDNLLFSGWDDFPAQFKEEENQDVILESGKKLLAEIREKNLKSHYVTEAAMQKVLQRRLDWLQAACPLNSKQKLRRLISRDRVKAILTPVLYPFRRVTKVLMRDVDWFIDKQIERWTWERYQITEKLIKQRSKTLEDKINDILDQVKTINGQIQISNRVPYHHGEKIRFAYIFQQPSVWPSFASVYEILKNDERFDIKFLLYDRELKEANQMMTGARELLIEKNIPFEDAYDFDFYEFRPHIVMYQTPWDNAHRPRFLQSDMVYEIGSRLAYITYGIEYSQSVWDDHIFSNNKFLIKPWRMYTISNKMKMDHWRISKQRSSFLRVTGHPKFDLLYRNLQKEKASLLSPELKEMIGGRKIIFWQMHFPIRNNKNGALPVTSLGDYCQFADYIPELADRYFVLVRPHPKFFEEYEKLGWGYKAEELLSAVEAAPNAVVYDDPDYTPALTAADAIIGDRSALMIESAVIGCPVLFMTNLWYKEQMLEAVAPIFDSYYQGSEFYDMKFFIETVLDKNFDYKKEVREQAAKDCIPFFDGQCGRRIVENLVESIYSEEVEEDA